jgi:anhydro-N-acetylmuramic acid kinase
LPDEVILAGGGAANDTLLRRIIEHLRQAQPALRVLTVDELGWPIQSVEPAAFALLAAFRLWGHPGNLPTTTGCRRSALLGQVAEP